MARLARDELLNPLSIQVVPTTNNASVEHSSVEKIHIYKDDEHHRDVDLFFQFSSFTAPSGHSLARIP